MSQKPNRPASKVAVFGNTDAIIIQRLWDLVRFMRGELYQAGLLSDDELAALVQDHPAVQRLETYDSMRAEIKRLKETYGV